VAAGQGRRMTQKTPKQFLPLQGRPILLYAISAVEKSQNIKCAALVLRRQDFARGRRLLRSISPKKRWVIIEGGKERYDSVREGIAALGERCDPILIHDAARPLANARLFDQVVAASHQYGAALAAIPCPDTIKQATNKRLVYKTVPRRGIWLAQTPQGFRRSIAQHVFKGTGRGVTDDVQIAERLGRPVKLVMGSPLNFKITTPENLALARAWLKDREE